MRGLSGVAEAVAEGSLRALDDSSRAEGADPISGGAQGKR
jgi:hypothetical protein